MLDILASTPVQFFLLALCAGMLRSDLAVPEQITKAMSMFLMIAIGMKGGLALRQSSIDEVASVWILFITAITLSFLLPFVGYTILRFISPLTRLDAAAVSAHYGSVSVVTFSYAVSYLESRGYSYAGYIVALMAMMEAPAILSGILLARESKSINPDSRARLFSGHVIRDAMFNSSIVLLIGAMIIAFNSDSHDLARITPYIINPFYAVLCLFLLELGLVTSRQCLQLRRFPIGLIIFAIIMPCLSASIAIGLSVVLNLAFAEAMLFTVLAASASYIAVPAAMKLALPDANPAYYITASLAITFPFNLIFGVPMYYQVLKMVL
ncbi:MAG: sodium-dependent bicarbonate transport family permease [Alphaproteobacteria bacterium]|nr:MAG: sodium-dependent bicarbonate transport family permease [Alphaproteobacteria bacterium]TAF41471.1 MAG: sodium-dependent bicarbonate transport family permease [Alphaproteobacteria bacterium]TAF75721.1 MAG: sodium-dependent bicarbonate transport family permease [Alphaproteobacteria bacterium]